MEKLKASQNMLILQEKMVSLGQFTAGIAHELNNPINYINHGATALNNEINDIFNILEAYRVQKNGSSKPKDHIISNAEQSIIKEGTLIISTKKENNTIIISIQDDGVGMKEEVMDHIFDPFYTTKR
ncbi:MAG: signal transduction histidine kinase [Saprospiraceae bacterium]|jgi:signal transduction histidine kinase